jgi:eukaryotic-like serine/threonine-protein kinase
MTDPVTRLQAALYDRYRIERELGRGGMATVYLAQDLRHKRRVALKVLKPELAAVLGAERFVQEIATTAALQHPHILPLFDSGTAADVLYYVMPFVDGETLRSKLQRETQLGIDEAVKLTIAMADALDCAHRHGVIHRDIKPENILLHDGRPVVADFGIALAVSAAAGGRMTETGLSLGTPHYMSPEQATAEKEITARSDVYSLGSVLYEMLSGNPPHTGASAQQIIMKIVTEEAVPVTRHRKAVPPNVAAAVAKALEKLPADRFGSAAEFAAALQNPRFSTATAGADTATPAKAFASRRPALILGAATALAMVFALWGWSRPLRTGGGLVTQFDLSVPDSVRVTEAPVLSPDGRVIVYAADAGAGSALYRRSLDQVEGVRIPGTEGAQQPFFSPDGAWVGFIADRKIHKIVLAGGARITLAEAPSLASGASWGPMDSIVFATGQVGLAMVAASGGAVTPLSLPDSTNQVKWPQFAGLGDRILLTLSTPSGWRAAVFKRSDGSIHVLAALGEAQNARYVAHGRLVYRQAGRLLQVPVDSRTLEPRESPAALPWVNLAGGRDTAAGLDFDASPRTLITSTWGSVTTALWWVGRDGSETEITQGDFLSLRLSPDDRYLALDTDSRAASDAVVYDFRRRAAVRLRGGSTPMWTPDGRRVVFGIGADLRWLANRPGESPELLLAGTDEAAFPHSFSPDGLLLAFYRIHRERARDIYVLPLQGDRLPIPYLITAANERSPEFSPDGAWIAYTSDPTGADEVYLRPYPGPGEATQVSIGGGREPLWSHDGRTIYYRGGGHVMSVSVSRQGREIRVGDPAPLFKDRYGGAYPWSGMRTYDLSNTGRFIMHRRPTTEAGTIRVTEHWLDGLQR